LCVFIINSESFAGIYPPSCASNNSVLSCVTQFALLPIWKKKHIGGNAVVFSSFNEKKELQIIAGRQQAFDDAKNRKCTPALAQKFPVVLWR